MERKGKRPVSRRVRPEPNKRQSQGVGGISGAAPAAGESDLAGHGRIDPSHPSGWYEMPAFSDDEIADMEAAWDEIGRREKEKKA